jgi:hypothetical protein
MEFRRPTRQQALAAAGLVMIAGAAAVVLRDREPAVTAQAAVGPVAPGVQLRTQADGTALRVQWNPDAPEIRAARRGVLVISDGIRESRMELEPRDLRAATVKYWPDTSDVRFRLDLEGGAAASPKAPAPKGPLVAANEQERRPSPFEKAEPPRKRHVPIKRIEPPQGPSQAAYEAEKSKRPSGISRAVGKIPLLRRLRKHKGEADRRETDR